MTLLIVDHDCDILLDQNLYAEQETRYKDKVSSQCRTLIGPRYALLRKEFAEWRKKVEPRQGKVRVFWYFLEELMLMTLQQKLFQLYQK